MVGIPYQLQIVFALVFVIALIFVAAWAVRRFGSGRLGGAGTRGRQPRLGVIDYAHVDGRRRLILIRRDNVEHLVMVGGPTDILVESNIVRAAPAARDVPPARTAPGVEALPRAIPLAEPAANGSWPLQPEPAAATPRAPRPESAGDETAQWPLQPQGEPAARSHRDTLTALADELSTKPAAPARGRPQASGRPQPAEPRVQESRLQEPRMQEPGTQEAQPAAAESGASVDQSLAEMAHRLEAALRKPNAKSEPRPGEPAAAAPQRPRPAEIKPPRSEAKPPAKTLYDSLEQEMASLLGRPATKN